MVIDIDCICSCKPNYHTITIMAVKKITTYDLEIQVLASDRHKNVVQLNRFHLFDVLAFLKNSIYLKSRIKVC